MKYIAILGSTGSIGTQTLEVVRAQQDIKVTALSAGDNIDLLERQIREFKPVLAAVKTEEKAKELALRISDLDIPVLFGMDGLMAVACEEKAEVLVTAIVGMLGIRPTVAAIEGRKRHCTGKQRNTGNGGTYYYAAGRGMRCAVSFR